ncbi:MAG: hypothetical protein ACO1PZ_04625 [Gammaproteobacteria bacterium]
MNVEPNAGSTGQNLKPAHAAQKGGRLLSVVHGKDERSLHLSPILQQIKDDGPALIDGEVVKEAAAVSRIAKNVAETKPPAAAVPAAQPLMADRQVKILLGFCAALALGLSASLYFSWQQQQRIANVEYMLEVLVTAPR